VSFAKPSVRIPKNGFFKSPTQWVFWVLLGFFGFIGVFLDKQEKVWVFRWVYPKKPTGFFGYIPRCLNPAQHAHLTLSYLMICPMQCNAYLTFFTLNLGQLVLRTHQFGPIHKPNVSNLCSRIYVLYTNDKFYVCNLTTEISKFNVIILKCSWCIVTCVSCSIGALQ